MPAGWIFNREKTLGNIYGLFVGVNDYREESHLSDLSGSINDAKGLYEAWHEGVKKNCCLLTSPSQDEGTYANRKNILDRLSHFMSIAKKDDLLVFHLSGHGTTLGNEFTFLPGDAESKNILSSGIVIDSLLSVFSESAKEGVKVLLITDACHAGAVKFNISEFSGTAKGGISCLFAAAMEETAGEIDNQGVFSTGLIKGLKGAADVQKKGYITLRDLYDYAYQYVKKVNNSQHPILIGTLPGNTIVKMLTKE